LAKNWRFFAQAAASYYKNLIITLLTRQFFRRKLAKIAENRDHNIGPRYLGSGSDVPVRDWRRIFVSDVLWMPNNPGNALVSHDDSCLQSNTRSAAHS
jgi:hypothetical protein